MSMSYDPTAARQHATGPCHTATIHELVSRPDRHEAGRFVWVPLCATRTQLYGEAWHTLPAVTCKRCAAKAAKRTAWHGGSDAQGVYRGD